MVKSHAFRLVPGWKLDCLSHALTSVSWTRSSALSEFCASDIPKARRLGIAPRRSLLNPASEDMGSGLLLRIALGRLFSGLEIAKQGLEAIGNLGRNQP